jgi:membrane protease YdiL (CAAX protease family)
LVVPGLGQYIHGAPWVGLGYSGAFVGGLLASNAFGGSPDLDPLPRSTDDQLAFESLHLAVSSQFLSAWDAFHRPMPALQGAGKYEFLGEPEDLGDLLTAPLDYRFLGRWTTWVGVGFTGGVLAWVLAEDHDSGGGPPFRPRDAAFAASLSLNAAVGEEALFRGWLLPMLTQKTGGRFWLANGIQAALFGLAHPQADEFAFVIAADAFYFGWMTRRNDWSIREGVFQHFWYDAALVTAALLADDSRRVTLLPVRLRF